MPELVGRILGKAFRLLIGATCLDGRVSRTANQDYLPRKYLQIRPTIIVIWWADRPTEKKAKPSEIAVSTKDTKGKAL
jgi:hypothetical protein